MVRRVPSLRTGRTETSATNRQNSLLSSSCPSAKTERTPRAHVNDSQSTLWNSPNDDEYMRDEVRPQARVSITVLHSTLHHDQASSRISFREHLHLLVALLLSCYLAFSPSLSSFLAALLLLNPRRRSDNMMCSCRHLLPRSCFCRAPPSRTDVSGRYGNSFILKVLGATCMYFCLSPFLVKRHSP